MTTRGETSSGSEATAQPIFILASERSGTNLLRRKLTEAQSKLFGPSPLHVLKHVYYAEPYYGDLSRKKNFIDFSADCAGLAVHHFSPWDVNITADDLWKWHQENWGRKPSSISIMHAMFSLYAQEKGYSSYICKDNNLFNYTDSIARELPDANYIYLYRDPRDALLSQLARPGQVRGAYDLAVLWRDEQIKCIQAANALSAAGKRVVAVSYEELVSQESVTLARICEALGLPMSKTPSRDVYASEQADIHEWKNLSKATTNSRVGVYKTALPKRQIAMIEDVAWHQIKYLGYKTEHDTRLGINYRAVQMQRMIDLVKGRIKSIRFKKIASEGQILRSKYVGALRKKHYL